MASAGRPPMRRRKVGPGAWRHVTTSAVGLQFCRKNSKGLHAMKVSPFPVFAAAAALVCAILLLPVPVQAQIDHLPALGSPAPASLIAADKKDKQCRTGEDHRD